MSLLPPEPVVPDELCSRASFRVRYDDIGQTGHLLLHALPIALGQTGWAVVSRMVAEEVFRKTRVLPILSRFIMEAGSAPFSVNTPLDAEGRIQFAHTIDSEGNVDRLVLNMWCSVHGFSGHTHGFPVPNAGERLFAGRIFAEHVLTRPFDPPENRRVTELELPGFPRIPEARSERRPPDDVLALPSGAEWLDDAMALDPAPIVFGSDRTDSNMHVNSLVYSRIFTDAILRRLWTHEKRFALRANTLNIAFRKPSFSGERVHVALRAFTQGDQYGAAAVLLGDEDAVRPIEMVKPRVFAQMSFVRE